MKHVLTLSESAELELLKNILEEGGIHCVLKNVQLAQALSTTPCNEELWVLNDNDFNPAQELCHDWFAPSDEDIGLWVCPQCGERLGSRFDVCWKCGTHHEIADELNKKGAIYYASISRSVD